MKANEAIIAWTPSDDPELRTRGEVKVRRVTSGSGDWVEEYAYSTGANYVHWQRLRGAARLNQVFREFHTLVLLHKLDPQVVHHAFLVIDEYADVFSDEMDQEIVSEYF